MKCFIYCINTQVYVPEDLVDVDTAHYEGHLATPGDMVILKRAVAAACRIYVRAQVLSYTFACIIKFKLLALAVGLTRHSIW